MALLADRSRQSERLSPEEECVSQRVTGTAGRQYRQTLAHVESAPVGLYHVIM